MKKHKHRLLTYTVLAASAVGAMYCINRFISNASILKNKLKTDKGHNYQWRFGNIHYKKKGSGSPIILIHDFSPYASSWEWNNVIDALANEHTVYALDLLGCGRSDKPKLTYTNFLFVQLLTDFTKEVVGEQADIITSGFSSSLSVMACVYNSSLFGKLFMINPVDLGSLSQNPTRHSKIAKFILELPIIGTFMYHIMTSRGNIDLLLTEKYLYNPFRVDSDMIDTYYESSHRGFGNGRFILSSLTGNYMSTNLPHGLASLKNQMYIIAGKHQPGIETTIEKYLSVNEHINSAVLPKSKFLPHLEVPELVLEQLKKSMEE